jgi:hypothetical protein
MGDTITHLPDEQAVVDLVENVSAMLVPGGCFVMTLRDYSSALTAERRFIPVRSDDRRILTCFLEYTESRVKVHDLLHERHGTEWRLRVSMYHKLRISPAWVADLLEKNRFTVEPRTNVSAMVCLVAHRR